MRIQHRTTVGIGLTALTVLIGLAFGDQLPARVAIHFTGSGQPDNYVSKPLALGVLPALQVALLGLFAVVPRIDPLGENIREFRRAYDVLVVLTVGFLGYSHALLVLWNAGYALAITRALVPASAVLYYVLGWVVERAEQNWFVGFRTPWTLSSERVWADTHALGGRLMKAAAVVTLGGLLFPGSAVLFLAVPVTAVAGFTVVYSYWDYRQGPGSE